MTASLDEMRAAATWIAECANELDDELTRVNRTLTDFLGDGWQGRAATATRRAGRSGQAARETS